MVTDWAKANSASKNDSLRGVVLKTYSKAETIVNGETIQEFDELETTSEEFQKAKTLGNTKHAFRGAALTLLAYKCCDADQDIRAHKAEYDGGFSARTFDTAVTVPFLIEKSLPRSVESHWLTQTLSFAEVLTEDTHLKTQPKAAGPLLVFVINAGQKKPSIAFDLLTALFISLIEIRNQERVVLTRPKNIPIASVRELLDQHFTQKYKSNAPRLPQIAVHAIYQCILFSVARYAGQQLQPLQRMKSADRKSGTVGDIVIHSNGAPTEAAEIKFGQPINYIHVMEAIDKVRAESVSRYYMLSTAGISEEDKEKIGLKTEEFRLQNGCEIIVNGVLDSICYYLRLLPSTTDFLKNYADLLENDEDVGYEHKISWNEVCKLI